MSSIKLFKILKYQGKSYYGGHNTFPILKPPQSHSEWKKGKYKNIQGGQFRRLASPWTLDHAQDIPTGHFSHHRLFCSFLKLCWSDTRSESTSFEMKFVWLARLEKLSTISSDSERLAGRMAWRQQPAFESAASAKSPPPPPQHPLKRARQV